MRSLLLLFSALLVFPCGGSLGGNPESKPPESVSPEGENPGSVDPGSVTAGGAKPDGANPSQPMVTFSLTDAPVEDFKNAFVTVVALRVSKKGEGWVDIPLKGPKEIDLLELQDGKSIVIGESSQLDEGTYEYIRLVLDKDHPSRLIDNAGQEYALKIPNANQAGLKIKASFVVAKDQPVKMTLDFDLRKSIKLTGNGRGKLKYMMKPSLRALHDSKVGTIKGEIRGEVVCLYKKGEAKDATDDCDDAVTSAKIKKSRFKMAFVEAGSYEIRVFSRGAAPRDFPDLVVEAGKKLDLGKLP